MYITLNKYLHVSAKEALGVKSTAEKRKNYRRIEELEDRKKRKKETFNKCLNTKDIEDEQIYKRFCYIVKQKIMKTKKRILGK